MAKEPAGLRRWRLAHKKKRRVRRVKTVARRRRYGRKRKGGRKSKAFPILASLPILVPAMEIYAAKPALTDLPGWVVGRTTGYNISSKSFDTSVVTRQLGLVIVGMVGHKLANRIGVNRQLKKLSMGFLQL